MLVLLQGLVALVGRYASTILNTVFGWATILLFGKVRQDRQIYLSIVTFGAVLWLILVAGIAFPRVASFILAFVTIPKSIDKNWIRLAMLGGALLLPAAVGAVSVYLLEPEGRPKTFGEKLKFYLKGYPYTLGLALTMVIMVGVAPVMKLKDLARKWQTTHVPVLIDEKKYQKVVDEIRSLLEQGGYRTEPRPATRMIRWPSKILAALAGNTVSQFISSRLVSLQNRTIELLLHPSDLIIRGVEEDMIRVHMLITRFLPFTSAFGTWDKDANLFEQRLKEIWAGVKDHKTWEASFKKLEELDRQLEKKHFPYEELEILYRERIQVELSLSKENFQIETAAQRPLNPYLKKRASV